MPDWRIRAIVALLETSEEYLAPFDPATSTGRLVATNAVAGPGPTSGALPNCSPSAPNRPRTRLPSEGPRSAPE